MQVSRRLHMQLTNPTQLSNSNEIDLLRALQPRLLNVSVLVCSKLFWPALPKQDLQITIPGARSALCRPLGPVFSRAPGSATNSLMYAFSSSRTVFATCWP